VASRTSVGSRSNLLGVDAMLRRLGFDHTTATLSTFESLSLASGGSESSESEENRALGIGVTILLGEPVRVERVDGMEITQEQTRASGDIG
jgi:hypothetical protein